MTYKTIVSKSLKYIICILLLVSPVSFTSVASADGGGGGEFQFQFKNKEKKATKKTSKKKRISRKDKAQKKTVTRKKKAVARKRSVTRKKTANTKRRAVRRAVVRRLETAPSGQPTAAETRFVQNEVIVRFQKSSTAGARNRIIRRTGMTHREAKTFFLAGITAHRYQLPAGLGVREAIRLLENDQSVVNAQPNYIYTLQQDAQSKKLPQFGNDRIGLSAAHSKTNGENVRIAVIDTLVDNSHAELSNTSLKVFDVSDAQSDNVDPHGTSIAGVLGANVKLTGVAPKAEIINVAAFSKDTSGKPTGNTWTVSEALNIALKEKANVLNLSFAGPEDPLLKQSLDGAKRRDMIPIAAAGNEGPDAGTLYPAGYESVIAVTATNDKDEVYSQANRGSYVDISAPGVGILVLGSNSGFKTSSGTSIATAYVSGIAALVLSTNPDVGYDALRTKLESSVIDLGEPGRDDIFGNGMLSATNALSVLAN